tara:strand:- start:639 stop:818 length:180 start_codon:yes stop_codon:yes gene_type:complete
VVRYPGSVDALRSRVARLNGLWGQSVKISYTKAGERMQKVPLKRQVRRSMSSPKLFLSF